MVVIWLVVLPLLVDLNTVTLQPTTKEAPRLDLGSCCPCPESALIDPAARSVHTSIGDTTATDRPCRARAGDAEASASFLLPALRAMQPYVKLSGQKTDPKPLLQPEVGLASSVLETLRQATDEEYQEALARDAARSAVRLIESTLDSPDDEASYETPKKKVRIFLNTKREDMDDNIPESSHVQETRCIHSPLKSIHQNRHLSSKYTTPIIEVTELLPKSKRILKNKGILHRNSQDMDNGIGASNIEELVIKPLLHHNSAGTNLISTSPLLNMLTSNNSKNTNNKELEKNISEDLNISQKIQPNLHLKLRELIDNLDVIAKKEKFIVPVMDIKKYISTTIIPPLKLKAAEKPLFNIQPLFPKHLLKFKDVELVPRRSLAKNIALEKSSRPSIKLQSDKSDVVDAEVSPSNSNLAFESNILDKNTKENLIPSECPINLENHGIPMEIEGQGGFGEIKLEEDAGKTKLSDSDNYILPTEYHFIAQSLNDKNEEQKLNSNGLQKEEVQNLEESENVIPEGSNNEGFQVELLEDLDTIIEYDNSSFNPKSYLENEDKISHTNANNENIFNDSAGDTSNNNLQIRNHCVEGSNIPQMNLGKIGDNSYLQDVTSSNSNFISAPQSSIEKSQVVNFMQQSSSEEDINVPFNNAHDDFSDIKEDSSQVKFRDLENMSNSILRLSECEPLPKENLNTISNLIEDNKKFFDHSNEDYDIPNVEVPASVYETNSKRIETEEVLDTESSSNIKLNELPDISLLDSDCKPATMDEITYNLNNENKEMQAEASESESKLFNPAIPLKTTTSINNVAKSDKHLVFLNNLKSKLENLFSTTERVSDVMRSPEDNANESSNMNTAITKFDKLNNLIKLHSTPHTLLQDISQSKLPGVPLKSYKNKSNPNDQDARLRANALNFLNIPLEMSSPFQDSLDPSLNFATLSDKLRSHTENTIQNVKETLESTLRDTQKISLSNPIDRTVTHDILGTISNRRDEMKEKLEALHLDLNDRFSSFHDSISNTFNTPLDETSDFKQQNYNPPLFRQSYTPKRKESTFPVVQKRLNVHHKHNSLPEVSVPKNEKKGEGSLMSQSGPTRADEARFRNFDRKLSSQNVIRYSTTTEIPSFISRPKVLKTKINLTPRLAGETLSKPRPSKIPMTSNGKTGRTGNLLKEPYISPSSSSKINIPFKSLKVKTEPINKDDSPVIKLRNTLLQRNHNHKPKKDQPVLEKSSSLKQNGGDFVSETKFPLSRIKEGRPRVGSRNNDELITSPTSHTDTAGPSQSVGHLRLVEPMKENVPYKCRLICYKDS